MDVVNKQIIWFAPKGECDADRIAVIRTPGNLRTIFGSNCDGKLIASGIASQLAEATFSLTPAAQRGFCRGRQLALNVVDLDAYTRAFNAMAGLAFDSVAEIGNIGNLPATALYDFCNAFPTLLHEWMWLVLNVLDMPTDIRNVIACLYTAITAYSSGCGDCTFKDGEYALPAIEFVLA